MIDVDNARQMAIAIGWLSTQPRAFADECAKRMFLRNYKPGDYLFHVDDEPGFMFFIVSGAVLVTLRHPILEPQMVHLGIHGDWLGEIAAVQGGTRRTSLEAATPLTVLCLTYASTREIGAHQPGAMQNFSSLITWNYEITIRSGLDFTIADPLARISARLLTLGGYGRNWPEDAGSVFLPITKEQLGTMAAVSRNSVHRALKILEERGICHGQYGGITILDAVSLKQFLLSTLHQKSR